MLCQEHLLRAQPWPASHCELHLQVNRLASLACGELQPAVASYCRSSTFQSATWQTVMVPAAAPDSSRGWALMAFGLEALPAVAACLRLASAAMATDPLEALLNWGWVGSSAKWWEVYSELKRGSVTSACPTMTHTAVSANVHAHISCWG